jgi:hypothetical protein
MQTGTIVKSNKSAKIRDSICAAGAPMSTAVAHGNTRSSGDGGATRTPHVGRKYGNMHNISYITGHLDRGI